MKLLAKMSAKLPAKLPTKRALALAAFLILLAIAGCSRPAPYYPPPPGFSQFAQQGFHDGFVAGRRDISHGLPPRVDRHGRFRNPPVPPPAIQDYRIGFRRGYDQVFRGGPPPPRY